MEHKKSIDFYYRRFDPMEVRLLLEPEVALFYTRVAIQAGVSLEQVISDALFKLAGELSLEALKG